MSTKEPHSFLDRIKMLGDKNFAILTIVLMLFVLPYLPLVLSMVETKLFDTNHVQDTCKTIGIFDILDSFYSATIFRVLDSL